MTTPLRFGSAVSAIALATMLAGCATTQPKTHFGGRAADENVGLATRAMAALNSNKIPEAIDFAERAVAQNPDDAGFRALLGNAYFAGGRFASAEAAFKDSLTLYSNQPGVILKLSLVETALGKKDEAVALLQAGRSALDASNYGLALALAGQPDQAIPVLEAAARGKGADATVRQNLALAHALAGDWTEAKTIAAQDVPANKLDARIHDWMHLAQPAKPSDQVTAFMGVAPAAVDPGQPVRLALRKTDTMVAEAAPVPAPAPQPQVAQVAPAPAPEVVQVAAPMPAPAPQELAAVATPEMPAPQPAVAEAPVPTPVAVLTSAAQQVSSAVESFITKKPAPVAKPAKAHRAVAARRPLAHGDSVVQLGSYRSPQQVAAGWAHLTQRYPALRGHLPLKARFDSPNGGTYWRLSIQGFSSQREAIDRCQVLKNRGGACFVRGVAGDAPVQIASN